MGLQAAPLDSGLGVGHDRRGADGACACDVGLQRVQRSGDVGRGNRASSKEYSRRDHSGTVDSWRLVSAGECGLLPRFAVCADCLVAARRVGCGEVVCGSARGGVANRGDGGLGVRSAARGGADGARIPYAMARDGVFFQFAEADASVVSYAERGAAFSGERSRLCSALTGTFEELYSLVCVCGVDFLCADGDCAVCGCGGPSPSLARPYRAWGYPWTPLVIFLVAAFALTVNLWMVRPVRSSVGLVVILAGIPFFYRWRKLVPGG